MRWLMLGTIFVAFTVCVAQPPVPTSDPDKPVARSKNQTDGPAVRPFTVRAVVDSRLPATFGDPVLFSIWVTPTSDVEISEIRIHPKGDLRGLYHSSETVDSSSESPESSVESADISPESAPPVSPSLVLQSKSGAEESLPGRSCSVQSYSRRSGQPFFASCELEPAHGRFESWFGWNIFLSPGNQAIDFEIALVASADSKAEFYDTLTVEFVSPKPVIIAGGFFGAMLLAAFTALASPRNQHRKMRAASWRDVWSTSVSSLPAWALATFHAWTRVLRMSLLGGACALVLIVLAQSTEGLSPPISVRVQDFWGGVLIGLMSLPMASWLRKKLVPPRVDDEKN